MKKHIFIILILSLGSLQTLFAQSSLMKINRTANKKTSIESRATNTLLDTTKNKPDTTKGSLETNPTLTNILGSDVIAPSIDLLGSKSADSGWFHGSIDIFSASLANKSSDSLIQSNYLLLPEASTFGLRIGTRFTRANDHYCNKKGKRAYGDSLKHLSGNIEINFLRKRLIQADKSVFEPYIFHFRIGGEYMPLKNWVSFYANISYILPITQNRNFSMYAPQINKNLLFLEYGAKFELPIGGVNTFFDFNFITINQRVNSITKTGDLAIPTIRMGITKNIIN
jgi:hypothetical protein